ncbi:MAG: phospholipase [Proteobacteria bacterium]|nr:phospholipase [Pseudomonadota bacterium]
MATRFSKTIPLPLVCLLALLFILPIPSLSHSTGQASDCRATLLKNRAYFPTLIKAIDNAKNEIVMSFFLFKTNGYRSNYPDRLLNHLIRAAERGVKVKVLLEIGKDSNSQINKNNIETAMRLRKGGIDVSFDHPTTRTHTKVVVIDRRYTFLGSHNLTSSALKYNNELSVLIDSPKVARKALSYINSLYR